MVKEVWSCYVKYRAVILNAVIGDSRRQVSLAAAARPPEDQPPFRIIGECLRRLISKSELLPVGGTIIYAFGIKVLEIKASQQPQVTVPLQMGSALGVRLLPGTLAGNDLAIVRLTRR